MADSEIRLPSSRKLYAKGTLPALPLSIYLTKLLLHRLAFLAVPRKMHFIKGLKHILSSNSSPVSDTILAVSTCNGATIAGLTFDQTLNGLVVEEVKFTILRSFTSVYRTWFSGCSDEVALEKSHLSVLPMEAINENSTKLFDKVVVEGLTIFIRDKFFTFTAENNSEILYMQM
ncbi:hypothetical protein ACFE04_004043 [Oxalis oulophora]